VQTLIQTSDRSWSEQDVKMMAAGGKVAMDEKAGDRKGPITIAVAVSMDAPDAPPPPPAAEGETPPGKPLMRVVVVGDSDFASNAAAGVQGNSDLFVNMNNWLTQQEDLISIRPRPEDDRRLTLNANQQRNIAWISLLLLPGIILGSGIYTWWQRR
jgi:ABC-type uncharacterized transport system involved in gliding motility auxiliary subunit